MSKDNNFDESLFEDVPYEVSESEIDPSLFEDEVEAPTMEEPRVAPIRATGLSPRDRVKDTEEDLESVQTVIDAGTGAVEGIPFAKDILSAGEALIEEGDFGENYTKNMKEWNRTIDEAEQRSPYAFTAGDIAATASMIPATGLAAGVGLAGVSGLSRSEDREFADFLGGAATGAAGVAVAKALALPFKAAGRFLGSMKDSGAIERAGGVSPGNIKKIKETSQRIFNPRGEKTVKETVKDFSDTIYSETLDGNPMFSVTDTPMDVLDKVKRKKSIYGEDIGEVLKEADKVIGKIDTEDVYNRIVRETDLIQKKASDDPATAKLAQSALKDLQDTFKTVVYPENAGGDAIPGFKKMSLNQLNQLKKDIGHTVRKSFIKEQGDLPLNVNAKKQQVGIISDEIKNIVDSSGVDPKTADSFRKLNDKWRVMDLIEDVNMEIVYKRSGGPMEAAKNTVGGLRGLVGAGMASSMGASREAAFAVGMGMNVIMNSPRTSSVLASGAKVLSDFVESNSDHEVVKRIATAAALSNDDFRKAVTSSISEVQLLQSPVPRTMDGLQANSDKILEVMEYVNPTYASDLRQALEEEDMEKAAALMDQASKTPKGKKLIQEGLGWDGKVYDPQEKAMLEQDIMKKDISLKQKLELKKKLNQQSLIPQYEAKESIPFKYLPRDKDRPEF